MPVTAPPQDSEDILIENISASGLFVARPILRTRLTARLANRLDIVALFDAHIGRHFVICLKIVLSFPHPGKVRRSEGVNNGAGMPLKISFFMPDASQ
jgi:hypothetical protein